MLALKPGLFPLPPLRCLLFLQSAFHSSFNSLQTLPNGFFTWGPQHAQASHQFPEISRTPQTQKGDPFLTLSRLSSGCISALFCTPDTKLGGQRGKSLFVGLTAADASGATPTEWRTCPESLINLAAEHTGAPWQEPAGVPGCARQLRGTGIPARAWLWGRLEAKGSGCGGSRAGARGGTLLPARHLA